MYIPRAFAETDDSTLCDFMEQHSFATLVSQSSAELIASHLPLLVEREEQKATRLIGHMARANPQWKELSGQNVLVMFQGPHSYISPSWMGVANSVPTWNYVAVHVSGRFELEESRSSRLEIVRRYVDFYESNMESPWQLDSADSDFVDGLLDAIVGFRIDIERIEGKWKLNQNHDKNRQQKVVRALNDAGGENSTDIANLMSVNCQEPLTEQSTMTPVSDPRHENDPVSEVTKTGVTIRRAVESDVQMIKKIYNEAILSTTATFDTETKSFEDRMRWFKSHDQRHPVIVAELDQVVVGWAALTQWSDRPAYVDTVESSLYVVESFRGRGIGRALKHRVIESARDLGYHTLIARAANASSASIHLSESFGFEHIGTMREVGFKFGQWHDVHIMQIFFDNEPVLEPD